jgi:transposase
MKEYSTFIGMDVHKNSIDIAIADEGRKGQVRHYGKIDGTLSALGQGRSQTGQQRQPIALCV